MRIASKLIGTVGNINFFLAIVDEVLPPHLLLTDKLDSNSVIMMFNSRSLKHLIRVLHLARANIIELERDEKRKAKEKKKEKRHGG